MPGISVHVPDPIYVEFQKLNVNRSKAITSVLFSILMEELEKNQSSPVKRGGKTQTPQEKMLSLVKTYDDFMLMLKKEVEADIRPTIEKELTESMLATISKRLSRPLIPE